MKIRIEIFEDNGGKSTFEFEGAEQTAIREKVINFLNASNVFSEPEAVQAPPIRAWDVGGTLMERLSIFIRYEFQDTWFNSQSLRERYETLVDDIKLSTVSTYLSRMHRDGLLERKGNRNNRHYRLSSKVENGIFEEVHPPAGMRAEIKSAHR
ncbi:MAG: hypothetical protein JW986_04245 [Methanotrichaceae archaeon]|nr:hypothetical protein [Methanotrichaceae archaeon]